MTANEIRHIILQGENETVEFKQSFSKAVVETIVAFSNAKGGQIIIGVNDKKKITGVSVSEESIQKWTNEIKQNTEPKLVPSVDTLQIDDKNVVVLTIVEYPIKPISYRGKYYKRVLNSNHLMSLNEVANIHLQTINSSWDYSSKI